MTDFIFTHLWQSTLFAGAAALLAWCLRHHPARTRHTIWMVASLKFLVPFSALVNLGRLFAWETADGALKSAVTLVESTALPFLAPALPATVLASPGTPSGVSVSLLASAIWVGGTLLLTAAWLKQWHHVRVARLEAIASTGREVEIMRRVAHQSGSPSIPLLLSSGSQEPGVIGWFRSEILWPREISRRLTDDQIAAILLHELAHVKRRDNLLALFHMTVQALFWFHPVVWLIGARLVDERERACDEEVVRMGADPHQYAESLLRTCEYAVESPLVCVSGVTGSDLKRRLRAIVLNRPAARLGYVMLGLLTGAGILAAGGPIAAGALLGSPQAPARQAPSDLKFEVASIKPIRPTGGGSSAVAVGGGGGNIFRHAGAISNLIQQAYQVPGPQLMGGPNWIHSDNDNYTINATIPAGVVRSPENVQAMLRNLLADRFKLVAREETRDMPIYALVHARADKRLGPNLKPTPADCAGRDDTREECIPRLTGNRGLVRGRNQTIGRLVAAGIGGLGYTAGRPIVDRTGLTGNFSWELVFAPEGVAAAGATDLPSFFTALEEQLGLKLQSERGPVRVVTIQSIERPTED